MTFGKLNFSIDSCVSMHEGGLTFKKKVGSSGFCNKDHHHNRNIMFVIAVTVFTH